MEKPSLDAQITDFQNQADKLHSLIMSEGEGITTPLKRERQAQRANIIQEMNILIGKKEAIQEAKALGKIHDLFKTTNRIIVLTVNGRRITPDEDQNITLKFSCGKHTKKIHISEIFTYGRTPITKQRLLSHWSSLLTSNTTLTHALTTGFNCKECRQAITKKFKLFRRSSPKDIIGTCSVALQII